jgi:hypothetical protein
MNIVALRHAISQSPADYAAAPLDAYKELVAQADQLQTFAKAVREFVEHVGELRYGEAARKARLANGRDFGVIRIRDHDEIIVCDQKRIVDWDQSQLAAIFNRMNAAGDDPARYMDVSFKVPESKYSAWHTALREQFAPARTVRPGKASYRLASLDIDTKDVQKLDTLTSGGGEVA